MSSMHMRRNTGSLRFVGKTMDYARALRSSAKSNWALDTRLVTQAMIMAIRMRTVLTLTLSYFRYNSDDSDEIANLSFDSEILK